tara:strand:+ start:342 stop:506 length:165 start_codon:yes stop_codon:yes gene_type:complete
MDKETDKFFEDVANNTPNEDMFDDIKEAEEDLVAGKTFTKLKEDLATTKRGKKN